MSVGVSYNDRYGFVSLTNTLGLINRLNSILTPYQQIPHLRDSIPILEQLRQDILDIYNIRIDINIVSGFATTDAIDCYGQYIHPSIIVDSMQQYIKSGAKICLDHNKNTVIGKMIDWELKKIDENHSGIYITTKIFDNYIENITDMINNKLITGFSLGSSGNFRYIEDNNIKNIKYIDLQEISLCRPGNPLALLE